MTMHDATIASGAKACPKPCACPCHKLTYEMMAHLPECAEGPPPEISDEQIREVGTEMIDATATVFGVSRDRVRQAMTHPGEAKVIPFPPAASPWSGGDDGRAWFRTLTGRQFFYDDPGAYPYELDEIAHALANMCRFAGHLRDFYSVAEHSVYVAEHVASVPGVDIRRVRAALIHDGSEAFALDIPRPMKRTPAFAEYRRLEDEIQRAILRRFGLLEFHDDPGMKIADAAVLHEEKVQLRGRADYWDLGVERARMKIRGFKPLDAKAFFLDAWRRFGGGEEAA
jgi:uncharacterized protein